MPARLAPAMAPTETPDETLGCAASPGSSGDPVDRAGEACRPLRLALPADPVAPSVARHRLRRWLAGLAWPAVELEDIVLAVSEAVSNATEYAYLQRPPGLIDVHGEVETTPGGPRRIVVVVRDHGRWRCPPIDDENRRRGVPLMRACMDTVTIGSPDDGGEGTCVALRSKAIRVTGPPAAD
jgi:serine/threonine-protein kinase RsbW